MTKYVSGKNLIFRLYAFTPAYLRGQGYGNTSELWGLFS